MLTLASLSSSSSSDSSVSSLSLLSSSTFSCEKEKAQTRFQKRTVFRGEPVPYVAGEESDCDAYDEDGPEDV